MNIQLNYASIEAPEQFLISKSVLGPFQHLTCLNLTDQNLSTNPVYTS